MITFLTVMHVFVSVLLVILVLLQQGKGADVGATFGGSSQTLFGATGAATFLSKLTVGMAAAFMVTSLLLAYLSSHRAGRSLFEQEKAATGVTVPVAPESGEKAPEPDRVPPDQPKTP